MGVSLQHIPPSFLLCVDLLHTGWEVHVQELMAARVVKFGSRLPYQLPGDEDSHSGPHEIIIGHTPVFMMGNASILASLNKQGQTMSKSLWQMLQEILTRMGRPHKRPFGEIYNTKKTILADQLNCHDLSVLHGMVIVTLNIQRVVSGIWQTNGGPVHNSEEQQASNLYVSNLRSHGWEGGCLPTSMEQSRDMCFPFICPDLSGTQTGNVPSGPSLTTTIVVSRSLDFVGQAP